MQNISFTIEDDLPVLPSSRQIKQIIVRRENQQTLGKVLRIPQPLDSSLPEDALPTLHRQFHLLQSRQQIWKGNYQCLQGGCFCVRSSPLLLLQLAVHIQLLEDLSLQPQFLSIGQSG